MTYPYYFAFGNNEKRAGLKGRACRVIENVTTKTSADNNLANFRRKKCQRP